MGLLKKLFGGGAPDALAIEPQSSQFHESETTAQQSGSRNAPRRELVHVVLRDTMRKHGIPSDWIDCRILSVVTRRRLSGMHVQFIVANGQVRLLEFVPAFQDSFWEEIEKFEPRARDWLFSLSWQFDGMTPHNRAMPAGGWGDGEDPRAGEDTEPVDANEDDLASDLAALYAIRDAALAQSAEPPAASPAAARPGPSQGPARS